MIAVHWFRRDLRLDDNTALIKALEAGLPILPIFIFDTNIINELPKNDPRLNFIYNTLLSIHNQLKKRNSGLLVLRGDPLKLWSEIVSKYSIASVFFNKDYEPYSLKRDKEISNLLDGNGIEVHICKDQVIFEKDEIIKKDGTPYTVFTPYKKKWLEKLPTINLSIGLTAKDNFYKSIPFQFPTQKDLGIEESDILVKEYNFSQLHEYHLLRDFPAADCTSYLGPHLRFGTISIRKIISQQIENEVFINELIWREFFMQILYHFPKVVGENFRAKYNGIKWCNNTHDFKHWCIGKTGYPLVDAGMRQLNKTGFMHNRVRMVVASFLCKHLLIDWKWGEAYFAEKLLDYELSSNNGNWQWAAGTGCDAVPYFRIFNPIEQQKKFDKYFQYIKKWVPEFGSQNYIEPIVDHKFARERTLEAYRKGLLL